MTSQYVNWLAHLVTPTHLAMLGTMLTRHIDSVVIPGHCRVLGMSPVLANIQRSTLALPRPLGVVPVAEFCADSGRIHALIQHLFKPQVIRR